ncbi:MAG: ArsR/SmtB family transcription factor [Dehalococcoidia bacterium]
MVSQATPLVRPSGAGAGVTAKFFRGLGDPTRVRVLQLLEEGERSVGELVDLTGTLQGRLSSHLACLRWCGFVATRREGRQVYYRIADDRVLGLLALADEFIAEHGEAVGLCRVIDDGD